MASIFGGGTRSAVQSSAPLIDLSVSGSGNAVTIPIPYGTVSLAANIIWSPGLVETSVTVTQSGGKGGPSTTSTQYEYTCSFAAGFCEGPGTISKIWGDTQVLYDNSSAVVQYQGIFNSGTLYQVGQVVKYDNGSTTQFYICIRTGTSLPFPAPSGVVGSLFWSNYTGNPVSIAGGQQYPSPTLYSGTNTQMPDPTIQAQLGVTATGAFRGLVYCVWENLQLNNFGNRIPNIRGVVTSGFPNASPPVITSGVDYIVENICERAGIPVSALDTTDLAPIVTTVADIYQSDGSGIPALTLVQGSGTINFYQGSGCGSPFGFHYPGDGSGSALPAPKFTYKMLPTQTILFNPYPADATHYPYTSFLPGWTTLNSYDLIPMAVVGVLPGGAGPATWDGTAVVPFIPGNVGDWSQANWDMVITHQLNVAVAGQYTFYCSSNDGVIIGIGNGATRVSGPMVINRGQTKTAAKGYPIMMAENIDMGEHDTGSTLSTFVVNFPKVGVYNIEVDYACHVDARTLCLNWKMGSVQSPLLPVAVSSGGSTPTEAFGFMVTEQKDARKLIGDLESAYFFDSCESDFIVKFTRRGMHPSVLTIPEDDLGMLSDNAKLKETIVQEQDAPRTVVVTFIDPSIDYQQGSQQRLRSSRVVTTLNQLRVDLPLVMSETMARQIAELTLYTTWMERTPYEINLWKPYYAVLDPTDTVDFIFEGVVYQQRLTEMSLGQNYALQTNGVSQFEGGYTTSAIGAPASGVVVVALPAGGPTVVFIYDIPYLQDDDASLNRLATGFYWVLVGDSVTWPGGVFLQSPTGSLYNTLGSMATRINYGYATDTLPDAPAFAVWDTTSTLNIAMVKGTLAGASDEDVLNGANVLLVGNELIQFANAVQEMDGTFTVSRLLRGRRNTEPFATGHAGVSGSPPEGEPVVVVTTGVTQRNTFPNSFIGNNEYYKAVTSGGDPTAVSATTFESAGNDLKPAMPVHVTGTRDISNNLTIGWVRRTRYGGLGLVGPTPLNEDVEAYSIDIMSGPTVKRTIAWTPGTYDGNGNPTAAYSAAQQTSDGFTPGNRVSVRIYQLSAQVGRGFPAAAVI